MAFLDELKRRLQLSQQGQTRQPVFSTNDPGISGRGNRASDMIVPRPPLPTPSTYNPPPAPDADITSSLPRPTTTDIGLPPPPPTFNPLRTKPSGEPEISPTATGDPLDIQSRYYNALQQWQPRGAKRGFKNSLKAGALMAAQAAAANPNDPVTAALAGFGIGAAGGTVRPDFKNKLVRGFRLQQAGGDLANQLELRKAQTQIEQAGMVPFQLPDGTWTTVPAKTAGTLASRQQVQQSQLSLRSQQLKEYRDRHAQMGRHEAAQDAFRVYSSGAADDNEDLRDQLASDMGLPEGTRLPPYTKGQIERDAQGNYIVVNPRSKVAAPVTEQGSTTPVGSFQKTQEAARQARFDENQRRLNAKTGTGAKSGFTPAQQQKRINDATTLHNKVLSYRQVAQQAGEAMKTGGAEAIITVNGKQVKAKDAMDIALSEAADAARSLRAGYGDLYDAGEGEADQSGRRWAYSQPRSDLENPIYPNPKQSTGATLEGAIDAFKRKAKRDPSPQEIENIKRHYGFQ